MATAHLNYFSAHGFLGAVPELVYPALRVERAFRPASRGPYNFVLRLLKSTTSAAEALFSLRLNAALKHLSTLARRI